MRANDEIFISRKRVTMLYAYMRQIDLSVHRCRWTSWQELVKYYEDKVPPEQVISTFGKNTSLKDVFRYYEIPSRATLSMKLGAFMNRLLWNRYYLTAQELENCCYLLSQFAQLLQNSNIDASTKNPDSNKIEELRLKVASFYNIILEPKLDGVALNKAMRVEHYLQNESLNTLTVEEIVASTD